VTANLDYDALGLVAPRERPAIPGGPQSVAEIFDDALARAPEREALIDGQRRYSYGKLERAVARAAGALASLGVKRGDRVAASAANSAKLVIAFFATERLGAVWVGVNGILAPPEKAFILKDAEVSVFLGDARRVAEILPLRGELPALRHAVAFDEGWAARCAAAAPFPRVDVDPFAPAAIAYTSGTTGFPKGAVHSQHNLVLIGAVHRTLGEVGPDTRHGAVLPLTILNLMVLGPVLAFQMGAAVVCVDRPKALPFADLIRRERIHHFAGVPTNLYDLLSNREIAPADLSTLRRPLVGGAEIPEALCQAYRERFGSEVIVGYGMTEAPTAVTMTDGLRPWQPGSCGKALPHVTVEVVDEQDRPMAAGEAGEITVRPSESGAFAGVYTPMLGYWKRPGATRATLRGGRFHSGDLGSIAEDGWLSFRGRLNDLIIRGGANVYPAEVERVLSEDARVAASAVIGRPDPRLGECVIAVVELAPGTRATADELRAHCERNLARYKVPEQIVFVEALPRNAMAKVNKAEVKKAFSGG
jgi:long-chain acyl-CoA synthetase